MRFTREVMPVVRVGDRPVGAGAPGPLTKRLMSAFGQAVSREMSGRPVANEA